MQRTRAKNAAGERIAIATANKQRTTTKSNNHNHNHNHIVLNNSGHNSNSNNKTKASTITTHHDNNDDRTTTYGTQHTEHKKADRTSPRRVCVSCTSRKTASPRAPSASLAFRSSSSKKLNLQIYSNIGPRNKTNLLRTY